MTKLAINGKMTAAARDAVEPHIGRIYSKPGVRVVALVELAHVERVEVAPGADTEPSVKMRMTLCEIPRPEQEDVLREAMRALYLQRTAHGTLDEASGMLELDAATLKSMPGLLQDIEVARLRAGLAHWHDYTRRVVSKAHKFSATEIAHELDTIADGLKVTLSTAVKDGDDG